MLKRVICGSMLTLLLIGMFFNVHTATAQSYYYNFEIEVLPKFPTNLDEVNVTISFDTASISYQVTFDPVDQVGNEFSVDISIYVPQIVLWAIGYAEHTYSLGKLPAGSYSFGATVWVFGYGFGTYQHSVSFTVSGLGIVDVSSDGKIDMRDIGIVVRAFGSQPGDASWNERADITGLEGFPDGKVDMADIGLVVKHFGETDP